MKLQQNKSKKAKVFNIQKFSIHDGPGIRTVVFLKGCPMECLWCANPESQAYNSEVAELPANCVNCGECIKVCPKDCIKLDSKGYPKIDRDICDNCGDCTDICYAQSKKYIGEEKTVEEVIDIIYKDRTYYENSGGGITFSGGEPLIHTEFIRDVGKECKKLGINVVVETCGHVNFESVSPILEYIDLIIMDIKEINPIKHKKFTGVNNNIILENVKNFSKAGKEILIRVPIIPKHNDSKENLIGISEFVKDIVNIKEVELLAYHDLGVNKYKMLERKYLLEDIETPSNETMEEYVALMNEILEPVGKRCFFEE